MPLRKPRWLPRHRVLNEYLGTSPTIAANLNNALATSLGQIPDGTSKAQGVGHGEQTAERIIELRVGDGCFAPVVFDVP